LLRSLARLCSADLHFFVPLGGVLIFVMSDSAFDDKVEMADEELDRAKREFSIVYGEAMAEWSSLEGQLFYWFQLVTGMNERLGRAIFFSARSFAARADMLAAALQASDCAAASSAPPQDVRPRCAVP
jgi:hypothetical protein